MSAAYSATCLSNGGIETAVLSGGPDGLTASIVPAANMVVQSLTYAGEELLATRAGLEAYVECGTTMGVPLLYPWANRLSAFCYRAAGREVVLDTHSSWLKLDANGLPIHGCLPGFLHWEVTELVAGEQAAWLVGRLDWKPEDAVFELFPFPHQLQYRAEVAAGKLSVTMTVDARDVPVPVSFGFHPYVRVCADQRASTRVNLPVTKRLLLNDLMIPTGETHPFEPGRRKLGLVGWDDAFTDLEEARGFSADGRTGEISTRFGAGYSYAQVFAPLDSDYVCFEPMTAPTNALVSGHDLAMVPPGGRYRASFEIMVNRFDASDIRA